MLICYDAPTQVVGILLSRNTVEPANINHLLELLRPVWILYEACHTGQHRISGSFIATQHDS